MIELARGLRDLVTRRGWQGVLIVVFVAVQALGPLHYYTVREDRHDERFAWRMFSSTRMMECQVAFTVDRQPVPLGATFHEAWIEIARRGRLVVLEAMGARLCRDHRGSEVVLDLRCVTVDKKRETWGGSDLCKFPDL